MQQPKSAGTAHLSRLVRRALPGKALAALPCAALLLVAGCSGGSTSPVAELSAPAPGGGSTATAAAPVGPRVADVRATFLPPGMAEFTAPGPEGSVTSAGGSGGTSAGSGSAGLLPPVSVGDGGPAPTAPSAGGSQGSGPSNAAPTGSRFAHTWIGPLTAVVSDAPLITLVGFPVNANPVGGAADTGGDWVQAGQRKVYLAERAEPDGTAFTVAWTEGDVAVSAKARKLDRATLLQVIAGLEAVQG